MIQTLLILEDPSLSPPSGAEFNLDLRDAFLHDALALAEQLPNTRAQPVRVAAALPALAQALASGPVVLLVADVPHLPIWRLRDAFAHLGAGADLVVGPAERGGWYLFGMAVGSQPLLPALPLADPASPLDHAMFRRAGATIATLPPWYRLSSVADLGRLAADLGPMPAGVATHTRSALSNAELHARAVGG